MTIRSVRGTAVLLRSSTFRLAVLAAAAFAYVTAETLPIGLLPEISADMGVSESSVGLLLTFYAYGVAAMTMPLITFVRRWPRRRVVVVTVAALAISQLISAVAVGYPMLVAARMVCAATHGVFWAVVAPVAATLALPGKQGKAIATVYAGTSLALVAGNPLSAAIGQWLGWRTAATCIGLVSAAIAVTLYFVLPVLKVAESAKSPGSKVRTVDRSLALICLATLLAVLGHFIAYTYFSLLLERGVGSIGSTLTVMLLLYGACGVLGIWIVGKTFDRWPRRSTIAALSVVTAALVVLWTTLQSAPGALAILAVLAIGLWGLAFTTVPVCLQSSVLNTPRADPDRASAIYVITFQVAIASGALVGGVLIDRSSIAVVTATAAVLVAAALLVVVLSRSMFPQRPQAEQTLAGTNNR